MGYGNYDLQAHIAATKARATRSADEIFTQNDCHPSMNPRGVKAREARDSDTHPDSVGVVFALDVSGSMGAIPQQLATKTMPTFMQAAMAVVPDPQVLFIAFGNVWADRSPLQVGQFESEAALIDKWLAATHLEGGGGGVGESYDLAMYFAARHTAMDCLLKRNRKGYFFMTGDEPPFLAVDRGKVLGLIGDQISEDIAIHDMVDELAKSFHPFFLFPDPQRAAESDYRKTWEMLLHERVIVLADPEDTAVACAALIAIQEGKATDPDAIAKLLETNLGRTGKARDRVVKAVAPYAAALAKGPIAGAQALFRRPPSSHQG